MCTAWMAGASSESRNPRHHEAEYVGEIVPRVGQEGDGVAGDAVAGLYQHEGVLSPMPMAKAVPKLAGACECPGRARDRGGHVPCPRHYAARAT